MNRRLIIVEGLPGAGKTTVSKIINEYLNNKNMDCRYFQEGDLDHPADYDGVSYFKKEDFVEKLKIFNKKISLFKKVSYQDKKGIYIFYAKNREFLETSLPDEFFNLIKDNDIYNLKFSLHKKLVMNKWRNFSKNALKDNYKYIFECCFLQNPITIGKIKENKPLNSIYKYINNLNLIIEPLDPLLIYIDQKNVKKSFDKIFKERDSNWKSFFIDYYTSNKFARENNIKGINGVIKILKKRKKWELDIISRLNIESKIVDNSNYEKSEILKQLSKII